MIESQLQGWAATAALAATGFVLGWSVAWPPGPVNTEIIRRGLARGFWPAYALCLGGCSGDAVWALLVAGGAGVVLATGIVHQVLTYTSLALLVFLAFHFFHGAWHSYRRWRAGEPMVYKSRFDSARGGFLLGVTITLTSPWSIAFWFAVMGRQDIAEHGFAAALTIASGVVLGAATWGLVLCSAVILMKARFENPLWDIVTRAATGALMLGFAIISM